MSLYKKKTKTHYRGTLMQFLNQIGIVLFVIFLVWLLIGNIVFKIRHPWATETETLFNFHKVLTFQKVSYQEMRPRD